MSKKLFEDSAKRMSRIIDYSEIKFDPLSIIGSGGFGKVYQGVLNGKEIGIKKITIADNDPNRDILLKFLEREIYTLKMLSHPNVIQFYGIAEKERSLFLLTELVSGGDLHWYIKNKNIEMTWRLKLKIARDIAASMVYLHENGIIHRDLKSTNLLVAENWVIKVCDMGLARKMDKSEKSKMTICGTDDWMAPEVLIGEEYDSACDVFSFGMVLIELITRENLTPRIRNEDLGVDQVYFLSKVPADCPKELLRLVSECCKVSPGGRPPASSIYGLLDFLLLKLKDLGSDYEPPLRSFKPPELHLPVPKNNNNNNNNNKENNNTNISNDDFSFPRPYQSNGSSDNNNSNGNNNNNNNSIDSSDSHFSFPRPYQPGQSNINNGIINQDSHFSFPRPYQPSVVILNDKGEEVDGEQHVDLALSQKDQLENELRGSNISDDDEMKQLKSQFNNSNFSFPRPAQNSRIISFNDTELLSFPRPWNPEIDENSKNNNNNNGKLLEDPKFSFPRPWNPENDTPLSTISSSSSTSSSLRTSTDSTSSLSSTSSSSSTSSLRSSNDSVSSTSSSSSNSSIPKIKPQQPPPLSFKPSTSQRVITTTLGQSRVQSTAYVQPTPSSIVTSTATAQLKRRSSSSPPKPSVLITNSNNNFSSNNNNKPQFNNTPSTTPTTTTKTTTTTTTTTTNNNKINVKNENEKIKSNETSNTNIVGQIVQNINNNNNSQTNEKIKIITPRNEEKNNNNNTNTNNQVDSVVHRRSRSLDIKNSTKAIIKKFEELTRFNSQQNNLVHPPQSSNIKNNNQQQQQPSHMEGKLTFGQGDPIVFERTSPISSPKTLNIPIPTLSSNSTSTPNTTNIPLSPTKKSIWNTKK